MRLLSLICALVLVAAAQTVDGVNVSVSRSVNVQPDQAEFNAVVSVGLDTTQQQVAQFFRDLGAANAAVVNTAAGVNTYSCPYPPEPVRSQFYFQVTFTTPPGAVKELATKLDDARMNLPEGFTSLQYVAALTATPAAVESVRKAVLPQLLAEARTKGQALAEAAGVKLGAVAGLSENMYSYGGSVPGGYFLSNSVLSGSYSAASFGTQYTFSAFVKFTTQ